MNREQFIQTYNFSLPKYDKTYSRLTPTQQDHSQFTQAAVLIGLVERENGLNVILTKRASHLKHHPGQICFPGGKYEQDDGNIEQTALREAEEEAGIINEQVELFGTLPPFPSVSRFIVKPVVGFVDSNYQPSIDTNEVHSLFEVPASFLFNQQNLKVHSIYRANRIIQLPALCYKQHFIWGMTAQIINMLQAQLSVLFAD